MTNSSHLDLSTIDTVSSPPKVSMVGQVFSRLTVIEFYGRRNYRAFYRCMCECGTECVIEASKLKNGHTSSCGCYHADNNRSVHFMDISGMRFGRLTVIRHSRRRNRQTLWWARCDCGVEKEFNASHLSEGRSKSCGCLRREILESKSGELSSLWRGGYYKVYPKEWNDALKESVRNRDNRKCQFPECDYTDIGKSKKLDVHHIDGNKSDCRNINLTSLCHSHHMKVEMSPESWQEYFYNINYDYEFR